MAARRQYRLLDAFARLFCGTQYHHRNASQGDRVAIELFEDLVSVGPARRLANRVESGDRVVNLGEVPVGRFGRRGDSTFGERVPASQAMMEPGFTVSRARVATVEIGAETKVIAKAMIKQIDRVVGDLKRQTDIFRSHGGNPICVALVGVNYSDCYTSYEGDRAYPTDGRRYRHPCQEAPEAERRLLGEAAASFVEFLVFRYKATNVPPYPFEWVDFDQICLEYSAMLVRLSNEYETRFP